MLTGDNRFSSFEKSKGISTGSKSDRKEATNPYGHKPKNENAERSALIREHQNFMMSASVN